MRCILVLLCALSPLIAYADENLAAELLNRIRRGGESQFRYEEVRNLELASAPWHGEGYMLSGADGSLVKLQIKPKRVVMAIAHQRMYYWDPQLKQRHAAPLGGGGAAADQIGLFRSLLQGNADELQKTYDFAAEQRGKDWRLHLTPKAGKSAAPSVELSGNQDDSQRRIQISEPGGDSSEYRMTKASKDSQADHSIADLLKEAIGE